MSLISKDLNLVVVERIRRSIRRRRSTTEHEPDDGAKREETRNERDRVERLHDKKVQFAVTMFTHAYLLVSMFFAIRSHSKLLILMKIRISELRDIIQNVLEEDMAGYTGMTPQAHGMLNTNPNAANAAKKGPPPLPAAAKKQPASAALPQKGALTKFKADVNMAADAASRVKAAVEQANTPEALRWLDKMIAFATSAKANLPNVK